MGLRSVVRTEGCNARVSQRLKRWYTIIDKLEREPTMQLANMQEHRLPRRHSIDDLRLSLLVPCAR
jgi:hypothetical protein